MRYNFKNTGLLALALVAERVKAEMGWVDAQCLLSDAQAFTATAVSTNTYDTDSATNDIGIGEPMSIEVSVDVAAGGTTPTFTFNVISSASANLGSATTLNSVTVLAATLVAGYKFSIVIPGGKTQRYLGLSLTLGGTAPTITITASIKPYSMTEDRKYYPDAVTIS